jgi:hypothetical protein
MLLSKFRSINIARSYSPLRNETIARIAPSIFAQGAHASRSHRYTHIATIDVLDGLRKKGFQPFMIGQTRVQNERKIKHTKHMIRLRHESQITSAEANEIVLLNLTFRTLVCRNFN